MRSRKRKLIVLRHGSSSHLRENEPFRVDPVFYNDELKGSYLTVKMRSINEIVKYEPKEGGHNGGYYAEQPRADE